MLVMLLKGLGALPRRGFEGTVETKRDLIVIKALDGEGVREARVRCLIADGCFVGTVVVGALVCFGGAVTVGGGRATLAGAETDTFGGRARVVESFPTCALRSEMILCFSRSSFD